MAKPNPIERRLQQLSDQWALFSADTDARILRWLIRDDERRMLETFFAVESDERAAEHCDFFYTLGTAFRDPHQHGLALRSAWLEQYRTITPALHSEQLDAGWAPQVPEANSGEPDIACLLRTCASFYKHYSLQGLLVMVLDPSAVASPEQYQLWLGRFALAAPPELRAIVIEHEAAPCADTLAKHHDVRVKTIRASLDMPAALEEISQEAGNLDEPGGQFRDLFVKLTNALGRNDLTLAEQLGAAAVTLAASQNWFHLMVPVLIALGTGRGSAGQHEQALAAYAAAEAAAVRGETECPVEARPTCKQLVLQSRLGCGLALIHAKVWKLAAEKYSSAAPLALALDNTRSELDCHRLASFCYEQHGDRESAWREGMEGLRVARAMDAETLATSTFAHLGTALVRLSQRAAQRDIEREICEIAGTEDWRLAAQAVL